MDIASSHPYAGTNWPLAVHLQHRDQRHDQPLTTSAALKTIRADPRQGGGAAGAKPWLDRVRVQHLCRVRAVRRSPRRTRRSTSGSPSSFSASGARRTGLIWVGQQDRRGGEHGRGLGRDRSSADSSPKPARRGALRRGAPRGSSLRRTRTPLAELPAGPLRGGPRRVPAHGALARWRAAAPSSGHLSRTLTNAGRSFAAELLRASAGSST